MQACAFWFVTVYLNLLGGGEDDGTVGTAVVPLIWRSEGPAKERRVDSADQDHCCLSGMVRHGIELGLAGFKLSFFAEDVIPWLGSVGMRLKFGHFF